MRRVRPGVARGVLGLIAVGSGVAGALLHWVNALAGQAAEPSFWLMGAAGAVGFGGASTFLALRNKAPTVGWVMLGIGMGHGLALVGREYGTASMAWDLPFAVGAVWLGSWLWAPAYLLSGTLLPLVLPDGHLPSPRWRPAVVLSLLAVTGTAAYRAFLPYELHDIPLHVPLPHPVGTPLAASPAVNAPVTALSLAALVVAFTSVAVRWTRSTGERRQQLKWILLGAVTALVMFTVAVMMPLPAGEVVAGLAVLPIPLSCAGAVVRHRLWDVDVVLSRSLVCAALSVTVVATYVVALGVVGGLLGQQTGAPLLATVVVAVVVVAAHGPVRRFVNRLVHGENDDPYTALARLGDRLAATADPNDISDQLLPEVVRRVSRLLRSSYVAIELAGGETVEHGALPDMVDRVPLRYGGSEVGSLILTARPGRSRGERRRLDHLAMQAAITVHSVQLIRDVRRSRQLVVAAREEERRRLRRDLHDGIGPGLAALALQAETARVLLPHDPAASIAMLDRLVPRLNGAVADVRAMAHELRSPALDELGLAGAVRELAARFGGPARTVDVELGECTGLPAAVDTAAYRIVAEALTNAARHADPRQVTVTLHSDGTWLHVGIEDDGKGIDPDAPAGLGLRSMRERAEELDGHCTIGRPNGRRGTAVMARLPVIVPVTVP